VRNLFTSSNSKIGQSQSCILKVKGTIYDIEVQRKPYICELINRKQTMSDMLREKRATRGLRMADLVGEAAEQDDAFWNHETWAEGEEDEEDSGNESFSEEEIKPDVFDSDFNDSETESDSDADSEEDKQRGKERREKAKASAAKSKFREPGGSKPIISFGADAAAEEEGDRAAGTSTPKPKAAGSEARGSASVLFDSTPRTMRDSTKARTEHGESVRKSMQAESVAKHKQRGPVALVVKPVFTQKELLTNALETEELNLAWLSGQKFSDDKRAESDKPTKKVRSDGYTRTLSRRGTYDTITFTNTDSMPSVFNLPEPQPKARHRCSITGLPAKYFDPLTQAPYATAEAFAVLRVRHKMSVTAR